MAIGDVIRRMSAPQPPARPQPARPADPVQRVAASPRFVTAPPPAVIAPDPVQHSITVSKPILDPRHVTRLVAQSDGAPQRSRSGGNNDGYLHASSLIGCCEREHCISQQQGLPTAKTVNGPMRIIWAIGRAVEKHIREAVIEARDYHGVYGNWRCACEGVNYTDLYVRGRICNRCGKEANRYFEPVLSNDFMRVVGSPDLTLVEQGWYMPVEIKSMNKDQFDKLDAPLADHCIQGCMYRWLYEQLGFPVMDVVPIMYGRKDFLFGGTFSGYKEFHVNYADWRVRVENTFAVGQRIAAHNEAQTLPTRICSTPRDTLAKACSRAALCFGLD